MRIKKKRKVKSKQVTLRANEKELNAMKRKANLYTEGNLSEWIIYAASNHTVPKDELEG